MTTKPFPDRRISAGWTLTGLAVFIVVWAAIFDLWNWWPFAVAVLLVAVFHKPK